MTRRDDRGLYDEGSKSKQVQDLQRRCELIHDTAPICAAYTAKATFEGL